MPVAAKKFDPAKWAIEQPKKRNGGIVCWICAHPAAAEAVRVWHEGNLAGKWSLSRPQMAKALCEQFGFPYLSNVVSRHITQHGGTNAQAA